MVMIGLWLTWEENVFYTENNRLLVRIKNWDAEERTCIHIRFNITKRIKWELHIIQIIYDGWKRRESTF